MRRRESRRRRRHRRASRKRHARDVEGGRQIVAFQQAQERQRAEMEVGAAAADGAPAGAGDAAGRQRGVGGEARGGRGALAAFNAAPAGHQQDARQRKRRAVAEADVIHHESERSPRDCERSDDYYCGIYSGGDYGDGGGYGGAQEL
mgnify:CR=1 FL=1